MNFSLSYSGNCAGADRDSGVHPLCLCRVLRPMQRYTALWRTGNHSNLAVTLATLAVTLAT